MTIFSRILLVVIFIPLAIVLIALAVANREPVAFTLDPFNPGNPALTLHLPLFILLFMALMLGLVVGGAGTWLRQGRYRRLARQRDEELRNLRKAAVRDTAQGTALAKPAA